MNRPIQSPSRDWQDSTTGSGAGLGSQGAVVSMTQAGTSMP